jgi:hypothetical protein
MNLNNFEFISPYINYWFVRTDNGQYFDSFYENSFIGINWNEINHSDLKKTEPEIRDKIARTYGFDPQTTKGKRKISDIYTKLTRFRDLKTDDIIVIPSKNSSVLAFGKIIDEEIFEELNNRVGCSYYKRRRVQWVAKHNFERLDPAFHRIKKSRHTICTVNDSSHFIDSVLYDVYLKGDDSHVVLEVGTRDDINWKALTELLNDLHLFLDLINTEFNLGEPTDSSSIKLNLQSRGLINLKQKGKSLFYLAAMLGLAGCSTSQFTPSEKSKADSICNGHLIELNRFKANADTLNLNLHQ